MVQSTSEILEERGSRYGAFSGHSAVSQGIQHIISTHNVAKWGAMQPDQREALFMIAHKMGRIINGDPDYADSWIDIAGYATLVSNRLEEQNKTINKNVEIVGECEQNYNRGYDLRGKISCDR